MAIQRRNLLNGKERRRNGILHESLPYLKRRLKRAFLPINWIRYYTELHTSYDELELKNDQYLAYCDSGDDADEVEIENANKMMENSYRNCCQLIIYGNLHKI